MTHRSLVVWSILAALASACGGEDPGDAELGYVGRSTCADCHADQVAAFTGSDHDLAMDHATPETVLGDFSDVTVVRDGVENRFLRRDDRYFVVTDGANGEPVEVEVLYTFGVRPLQQYLVELDGGRIQRLPWSWDSRPREEGGQRWFHTYGDERVGPDDVLHWTRSSQNWNRMCADCHSTDLNKAYDPAANAYATTWSEMDVSCEACHGPASGHLAWAARPDAGDSGSAGAGFAVRLSAADAGMWIRDGSSPTAHRTAPRTDDAPMEVCARCHSHRTPIAEHRAGGRFADEYRLSLPREPLYHPDGQVREEVFVYGSFLQSRMYRAGVTCTNCHEAHSGKPRVDGNGLCTQCHSAEAFDTVRHHRHEDGARVPACVDCHMRTQTFMQVDARRDHFIRIPRPTVEGAPNACLDCHQGRGTGWVASTLDGWYGPPTDSTRLLDGFVFAAAERGEPGAVEGLARIARDTSASPITRATAVSYLERYPSQGSVAILAAATRDEAALVRREAVRALSMLDPSARLPLVSPLLEDPARLVRIAAARASTAVPRASLTDRQAVARDAASAEYERSRLLNADDPAATVELGDYEAERGSLVEAEAAYRRALALEPAFAPAYLNLADLYRSLGRETASRDLLVEGREQAPGSAVLAYAQGLALVRADRIEDAVAALAEARSLDPDDARYAVALVLALRRAGRTDEAARALEDGLASFPDDRQLTALVEDTPDATR